MHLFLFYSAAGGYNAASITMQERQVDRGDRSQLEGRMSNLESNEARRERKVAQ